jgi:uncharacterized protein
LVDTNLLVYAALPTSREHEQSRRWLTERFADQDSFVGLCWPTLYAFTRLISNRRLAGDEALSVAAAWTAADAYRRQRATRIIAAGEAHAGIAAELMATPGLGSRDVPDVELAALAIERGLTLCSHDRGFARFSGLRWLDPLESTP